MPQLQSSGLIKLTEIVSEFGGTAPHKFSEYYRGGSGGVGDNNTNVPTSGRIALTDFYNAVNSVTQTLADNSTNVNLSTTFGSDWASSIPKVLVVEAGSTIGGTGGTAAITVPTGMGGTLTIQNAGTIVGTGGAAGSAGGDAIVVNQTSGVTITNTGSIYGGGGGGGTGGNGSYSSTSNSGEIWNYSATYWYRRSNVGIRVYWNYSVVASHSNINTTSISSGGSTYTRGSFRTGLESGEAQGYGVTRVTTSTIYTNGGAGGIGAGYSQSAGTGSAGGTNAGTGGAGGGFGASGSAGANGNSTNGSAGGAAGNYINGISNVTLNNTGTVAGGTA